VSSDVRAGSDLHSRARDPYATLDLEREDGITTTEVVLPSAARHGGGGKFLLDDRDRDDQLAAKFDVGDDGRSFPDGSLYQHARAAFYAAVEDDRIVADEKGREYAVLARDYEHPATDEDGTYAVTLRSTRWKAGMGEGDDYGAWYKYDLTVRPLDEDGSIAFGRTPARSLSLKIMPQVDGLVYKDGNVLELPHGEGSLIQVQSTWVDETEQFIERAAHLLGHTLNYGLRRGDLVDDSAAFGKAEVHHRFDESAEGDLVQTVRQSAELLAQHSADVETSGVHEDDRWLEARIVTDGWAKLGFPRLDADILLKVYYPDNPEIVEYPMDQPKIEVALEGKETVVDEETGLTTERMIPWDRWDEVMAILEEILLSHLTWADVSPADLVADDYSEGPQAEPVAIQHPEGRRLWLRKHYESLVPALYREATKSNTDLIYDILDVVRRRRSVTYADLVDETGAARRTIREHVRRLEREVGGEDGPGLLERSRGHVTLVSFSSRYLEELTDDEGRHALEKIKPEETPADRRERATANVAAHLRDLGIDREDVEEYAAEIVAAEFVSVSDVRDAHSLDDLEDVLDGTDEVGDDDPGVDLGAYQQVDDSDGSEDAVEGDRDDDQEVSVDEKSASSAWMSLADLSVGVDFLASALRSGSLATDHVRIRTDPYPMLGD
jgi:hypothetical protein